MYWQLNECYLTCFCSSLLSANPAQLSSAQLAYSLVLKHHSVIKHLQAQLTNRENACKPSSSDKQKRTKKKGRNTTLFCPTLVQRAPKLRCCTSPCSAKPPTHPPIPMLLIGPGAQKSSFASQPRHAARGLLKRPRTCKGCLVSALISSFGCC